MKSENDRNLYAILGFLLTLANIAVNVVLIVTKHGAAVLVVATIAALVGIVLCSMGVSRAKMVGKGRGLSVFGLVLNILILIAVALFTLFLVIFIQACSGIFQGITPN